MAFGTRKGAADFLEAGFNSPVEFQNYQPLTAVSTGKLEPVPCWRYSGLKCAWHSVELLRCCCASYCRSVCIILGTTHAVIYIFSFLCWFLWKQRSGYLWYNLWSWKKNRVKLFKEWKDLCLWWWRCFSDRRTESLSWNLHSEIRLLSNEFDPCAWWLCPAVHLTRLSRNLVESFSLLPLHFGQKFRTQVSFPSH